MGEIDELTKELEVVKAEEETLLSLKQIISHQLSQLEVSYLLQIHLNDRRGIFFMYYLMNFISYG